MKISYNWLKQYIDISHSPQELDALLTSVGLEIEGIEMAGGQDFTFEKVVVGLVKTVIQHPNADRLRVCTVDVAAADLLTIVCGAPNVAEGQKVAVALEGAVLHPTGSTEPLKIKRGKMRGQESQGMICAEDELGLGTNHEGIMILAEDAEIGTALEKILTANSDFELDVAITPNRIDAASHIGVAREIAALLDIPLKRPAIFDKTLLKNPNPIAIEIQAPEKCKRYTGVYIKGIEVKESPDWLKERLTSIGLRPINSIVDITNFVLMETGQPLHAFDADKLKGNQILVRTLAKNQKFTTLDEKERDLLAENDLMICDAETPHCIAGVFGGAASGVTLETKNIFLESAYFDPTSVRKTAKRLGISTDSSFRFERGADPNATEYAALRALHLITEIAGGEASVITDVKLADFAPFEVNLSIAKTWTIIGKQIPRAEIIDILHRLEMETEEDGGDIIKVKVPQYRVDVQRPQDVMEDILRIYGFDKIESSGKIEFTPHAGAKQDNYRLSQAVANALSSAGFYEMWNNSLSPKKFASENAVEIVNPLSEELAIMRETLLYGALEVIQYNQNRQNEDLALYEFGKTYWKKVNQEGKTSYKEKQWLTMFITGAKQALHWETKQSATTLFTLSKEVERLANLLGIKGEVKEIEHPEMDYALAYTVRKQQVFVYGKVKQSHQQAFDIRNEVFYLIGDWDLMAKLYFEKGIEYQAISQYPGIRRDISMLIPETETFENIRKAVRQVNPQLIKSVDLHDVYKGKNIEEGKKSYLISLFLQDETRTLADSLAEQVWEKVCKTLEHKIGAVIRKG